MGLWCLLPAVFRGHLKVLRESYSARDQIRTSLLCSESRLGRAFVRGVGIGAATFVQMLLAE